jgi:hypothetical protein
MRHETYVVVSGGRDYKIRCITEFAVYRGPFVYKKQLSKTTYSFQEIKQHISK